MEDNDSQLQFKKRARRRLVGAVFFASVVALVLPMVMDHEPRQPVQDVEIRIPGQDEKPFAPRFAAPPPESAPASEEAAPPLPPPEKAETPRAAPRFVPADKLPPEPAPAKAAEKAPEKPLDKPPAKLPEKAAPVDAGKAKAADKAPEKAADKAKANDKANDRPADKTPAKAEEKPKADDAKRAAAILAGKAEDKPAAAKGGEHVVLIGAFANDENVKIIKNKLGEMGIRVYTEPLDTPQGKKTRVRAGPFPSRDAADKALERMKKIGVGGVVAAKP